MDTITNVYLLKDLARLSGHSIHTIKFYLKLGLIKESGRSPQTRFRYFDDTTLAVLSQIRALRKQDNSLAEIAALLSRTSPSAGLRVQDSGPLPRTPNPEPRTSSIG
ncbi:MAG: MerR family transcriptional regulator [Candidatus Omnitrophica bacterium]|nr:MerR family transcriptional regulator [Candidatus Omnitrophota bacterium]